MSSEKHPPSCCLPDDRAATTWSSAIRAVRVAVGGGLEWGALIEDTGDKQRGGHPRNRNENPLQYIV